MPFSQLTAEQRPVIIFGAGVAGEALCFACRDAGVAVSCFCDNNTNKTGRNLCGVPILSLEMVAQNYLNPVFVIAAADICDVTAQLARSGFREWCDAVDLLQHFNIQDHPLSAPADFAEYVISTCVVCHQAFRAPHALFMRSVDLVITERCSLRCRDCANLMQYYRKPQNLNLDEILQSIDALADLTDAVNEIRVIGGEPLMHPDFPDIVQYLTTKSAFRKVVIYTNGTIHLSDEKLEKIRNSKVLFYITDYGPLSRNIRRLRERLEKNRIHHHIQAVSGWAKCGIIARHWRSDREQSAIFDNCCAKHLMTLLKGCLYRCPFSANAVNLEAIAQHSKDCVRILAGNDPGVLKQQVREFLQRRTPLQACDVCEGRPYGAALIPPAQQCPQPLAYQKSYPSQLPYESETTHS